MGRIADVLLRPERILPVVRTIAKRDWSSRLLTKVMAPFSPLDPRRYYDPYAVFGELRPYGPVYHHKRGGLWLVTGHAECEAVLRCPSSVARGPFLRKMKPYKELTERSFAMLANMLILVDPPDHTRLRNLVSRAFTPKTISALEPDIERVAADLLDELDGLDRVDAVERYASRLPIYIIGNLLGLPEADWDRLKDISDTIALFVDPVTGFEAREMQRALDDLSDLLGSLIERRRADPTDDLLSALVAEEADGDRLDEIELYSMITLLMVAGHETTTGLIANSLVHLDRHRDARTMLIERPEIAANAVEELLRFDAPVQATDRFPSVDLVLDGQTIPAGANVIVLLGAANRDARIHDEPDELRLDRDRPRPISFGHGIHHCIGASLARLEAQIAIPAFVERFPDYEVDEADIEWKRSLTLKGPSFLPIRVRPAAADHSLL